MIVELYSRQFGSYAKHGANDWFFFCSIIINMTRVSQLHGGLPQATAATKKMYRLKVQLQRLTITATHHQNLCKDRFIHIQILHFVIQVDYSLQEKWLEKVTKLYFTFWSNWRTLIYLSVPLKEATWYRSRTTRRICHLTTTNWLKASKAVSVRYFPCKFFLSQFF